MVQIIHNGFFAWAKICIKGRDDFNDWITSSTNFENYIMC